MTPEEEKNKRIGRAWAWITDEWQEFIVGSDVDKMSVAEMLPLFGEQLMRQFAATKQISEERQPDTRTIESESKLGMQHFSCHYERKVPGTGELMPTTTIIEAPTARHALVELRRIDPQFVKLIAEIRVVQAAG